MTQGTYRPAYKVTYKAGLDENGNLIAFHVRGAGTHGSPVFADRYPAGAVDNYLAENHAKNPIFQQEHGVHRDLILSQQPSNHSSTK